MVEIENENFQGEAWTENMISDLFAHSFYKVFGLFVDRALVGYCVLCVGDRQGDIGNIVVCNSHKGKGYGKQMLEYMQTQAVKEGIDELFLEVNTANTVAINMYKNAGFRVVNIRKNYYENSVYQTNDAYLMTKKV